MRTDRWCNRRNNNSLPMRISKVGRIQIMQERVIHNIFEKSKNIIHARKHFSMKWKTTRPIIFQSIFIFYRATNKIKNRHKTNKHENVNISTHSKVFSSNVKRPSIFFTPIVTIRIRNIFTITVIIVTVIIITISIITWL